MSNDLFSPATEAEREAFALIKRAFQDGASLAALCRAAAACLELQGASLNALASSGDAFTPAHLACLCLTRSAERGALLVAWLRDAASRLDTLPTSAQHLAELMASDGEAYAAFTRNLFGEDAP